MSDKEILVRAVIDCLIMFILMFIMPWYWAMLITMLIPIAIEVAVQLRRYHKLRQPMAVRIAHWKEVN